MQSHHCQIPKNKKAAALRKRTKGSDELNYSYIHIKYAKD